MKKLPIALAIAAITAASVQADVIYSTEDFEGGTPNYTFDGAGVETNIDAISSDTALLNTDYVAFNQSRMGVVANGEPLAISPAGEPTGKHGFVSTSSNRRLTLAAPMTLVTDSVDSVQVDFSFLQYGNGVPALGCAILTYSALGDFTDEVQIASFGIGQPESTWVVTPDYPLSEDTWNSLSLTITNGAFGVTPGVTPTPVEIVFTDTAKIRFYRPPVVVVAPDSTTNHICLFDDITITGVAGPAPAAPFAATITPAVSPATGYDIQWTSQTGATYSVLTSTDLATPVDSWTPVESGIAAAPPQNTYNVAADGVRRFYVIKETTP